MSITSPSILCGPFLRLVDKEQANIWFVTNQQQDYQIKVSTAAGELSVQQALDTVQIGERCFVNMVNVRPMDEVWSYAIEHNYVVTDNTQTIISPSGNDVFSFKVNEQISSVIQGSCRKPDHPSVDAFNGIAEQVKSNFTTRADYLLMTGDQIYADDVSAPMLVAAQTLSKKLGLYSAEHELGNVSKQQLDWRYSLNTRSQLFPKKEKQSRWSNFWHGDEIISSRFHDNHLIGLDEFFAVYLLTWSSTVWAMVKEEVTLAEKKVHGELKSAYRKDWIALQGFIETLPDFEYTLGNVPTLMIFDDHDVTDDWNLSVDWEEHVYGHLITRQMIRDALLSYAVFQGWGNNPDNHQPLISQIKLLSMTEDFADNNFTETLYDFNEWHYQVNSTPKIVVLDTRTHRWRSETSAKNPSGLMDFKHLEELERQLFEPQVAMLIVSPAPVFGVKAIEVVQKICALLGKELLVDVENWMAHQGSAKKLMNMLRHDSAPDEVIIMSGDVHYSFCFSAQRRFSSDTDRIWQLTCSGFKNQFPPGLLKFFDYIDRFLYSPHSLLNVFTKRRKLEIEHHPLKAEATRFKQRNLHTQSAAGLVELDSEGKLKGYSLITSDNHQLFFDLEES